MAERDLRARTAVLHAGRQHLADLVDRQHTTLQGRKAVVDVLAAAHSIPLREPDPVNWLVKEWRKSLDLLLDYRTADDNDPVGTHALLTALRGSLARTHPAPLQELFDKTVAFCATVYGPEWRAPSLEVKVRPSHPGRGPRFDDPYSLNASTERSPSGSTVTLEIYLAEFGPESYAVLPRVLLHEVFCHAVAGHRHFDSRQNSPFSEGWMDWAAQFHFDLWFSKADHAYAKSAHRHSGALVADFARRNDVVGGAREIGHRKVDSTRRWLRASGFDNDTARQRLAEMAVAVNMSQVPLDAKDRLTNKLGEPPDPDIQQFLLDCAARRATPEELLKAIGSW